mmetsp:Transcript_51519/g.129251  ORF Transcript_51519/g.129251 Transcript_51519/m.129251 type:complete len:273 (-) Transcript_51519:45-863(-)
MELLNVIQARAEEFTRWFAENAGEDKRVTNYPLIRTPLPVLCLIALYVALVFGLKKFMANRPPFELKKALIFHNLTLFCISCFMVYEISRQAYLSGFELVCNSVDRTETGVGMTKILWLFFFSKLIEFLDTMFMVLRKNFRQVSFLHVYHHITIFLFWWAGIFAAPGGEAWASATLNSFVHCWMYGYYLLAALGFKDMWWKPYLTQLQILQFFFNFGHAAYSLLFCDPSLDFPRWAGYGMLIYMSSLIVLFMNFYIRSYIAGKSKSPKKKTT